MTAHTTLRKNTGRTLAAGGFTSGLATATVAALLATTVATAVCGADRVRRKAGPGPGDAGQLVDVRVLQHPTPVERRP